MNLILIRHTRLEGAAGVCYGQSEMPLAETFSADADAVRRALPWQPGAIWSSPAQRCVRLAELLCGAGKVQPPLTLDGRLAELNFGVWEGRRWDELQGPEVEVWIRDPWRARPPGGETAGELVARVQAFREELLRHDSPTPTAVVTHAGVIRAWRSVAQGLPLSDVFAQPVAHGSIWVGA